MSERVREDYRGLTLIARTYKKVVRGKAWRDGHELVALEGDSEEAVLAALRAHIDEAFTVETTCGSVPYPPPAAYEDALRAKLALLTDRYRLMLRAHYHAPERTLSDTALAAAGAYATRSAAKLHYGKVGRMVGEYLLFQPRARASGDPDWALMLAEGTAGQTPGLHMRDEVARALEAVGIV